MAAYNDALGQMGPSIRAQHMVFLNEHLNLLPIKRKRCRHDSRIYMRGETVTREAMHASLRVADHAKVVRMLTPVPGRGTTRATERYSPASSSSVASGARSIVSMCIAEPTR